MENLELKKDNSAIKSRLQFLEGSVTSNSTRSLNKLAYNMPPPFQGTNFKMEDEEGELFTNTYLADLKSGKMGIDNFGRDSLPLSEINRRNSMYPPHLRSTYEPQYLDNDISVGEFRVSFFFHKIRMKVLNNPKFFVCFS